jgi:hypothetical protein
METRPGDPKHGDLRGGETLPRDERLGSFADGEETEPRTSARGWFAEGLEAKPRDGFRATVDMASGGGHGPE